MEAKFDKADAIKFNGSRSGSVDWTIELVLDGQPYAPEIPESAEPVATPKAEEEPKPTRPRRRAASNAAEPPETPKTDEDDGENDDPSVSEQATPPAPPTRENSFTKKIMGKDGNFHYCHVCKEVGDVVCCDGCPHVYHPQCLPADSESFAALDLQNDDDPWYCPDCYGKQNDLKNKKTKKRKAAGSPPNEMVSPYRQGRPKRKCSTDGNDAAKEQGMEVDEKDDSEETAGKKEEASDTEVSEANQSSTSPKTPAKISARSRSPTSARSRSPTSTTKKSSTAAVASSTKKKVKTKKQKTRTSRPISPIRLRATSPTTSKFDKKDKKKKKKKKDYEGDDVRKSSKGSKREGAMLTHMLNNKSAAVKATPAFYFFLLEARNKIERNLSRKHRYFNRLPKGNMERNQLIAKEGIVLWSKLKDEEIERFMDISMKDFERRIIEWKEEKTIRQMFAVEEGKSEEEQTHIEDNPDRDLLLEDERVTYDNHQRLYLSTTVGSKPYKPDMEESNNRILLELLQDTRFHPLPMIQANRSAQEYGEMDFERVTIPYFDINGPVSTCLGDECLGCSRGWTHFCNVLKRRVPAVTRRAKLQPPLSSLVATRIGLGLKDPPLGTDDAEMEAANRTGALLKANGGIKKTSGGDFEVFTTRDVPAAVTMKKLPLYPWEALSGPTERADDIVRFVEEAVCMKIPEPPRPGEEEPDDNEGTAVSLSATKKKSSTVLGLHLPTKTPKRHDGDGYGDAKEGDITVNKCGRCRTVIEGDTGCVPCRRAQLVINMSRGEGQASEESTQLLQVQTNMLGRIVVRDGEVDAQPQGDESVANHILRQRWTPFAILPPTTLVSPMPNSDEDSDSDTDEEDSADEDSDVEMEDATEDNAEKATTGKASEALNTVSDDTMASEGESSAMTSGNEDDSKGRPSKRLRTSSRTSSRIGAQETNPAESNTTSTKKKKAAEYDRSYMIRKFKEEANLFYKKCVSIACMGILLGLTRRDPLLHFAEPVEAEGYHDIIQDPMDFGKMKKKLFRRKYATLGSFVADAQLLCDNAMLFNPPDSIYYKTAKELSDALSIMHQRASEWLSTMKEAHSATFQNIFSSKSGETSSDDDEPETNNKQSSPFMGGDPFVKLRKEWPEAVEMYEETNWLHKAVETDFMRTKENENAYYGVMAIRRAAMAAAVSLAPYTDSGGMFNTVGRRTYQEDEKLRSFISKKVADTVQAPELKEIPHWREEMIMRVLRKSQARRMEGRLGSAHGCARCDGVKSADHDSNKAINAATVRWGRTRKKPNEVPRIHKSRLGLSTGLGSQIIQDRIQRHKTSDIRKGLRKGKAWALVAAANKINEVAVTARGSRIHGMGLFADQPLQKGDVVAEYVGEYVSPAVTNAREKTYQSERIQDYQFRIDSQLVIDATKRGGHGRYANHNCDPNCATKIIPFEITPRQPKLTADSSKEADASSTKDADKVGSSDVGSFSKMMDKDKQVPVTKGPKPTNKKNSILKRVVIVALRDIEPMEELTYDYQFPLEVNMEERIPCNCGSEMCRGFMNWDLPEKGAKNQVFRTQKRGANMRDRIRRLGRPLKGDK